MKNFFHKLIPTIVISAYLLMPLTTWATPMTIDDLANYYDQPTPVAPPVTTQDPTTNTSGTANTLGTQSTNPPPSAAQRMSALTAEDKQCSERQLPKANQQANTAGTLANLLSTAFNETLAKHVNDFFANKLPSLLQGNIKNKLPGLIKTGLNRQLYGDVSSEVYQQYGDTNPTNDQLKAIVKQVTERITAQIIKEQTPNIIRGTITENLPSYLSDSFSVDANNVVTTGEYAQRVREAVNTMNDMAKEAQEKAIADVAMQIFQGLQGGVSPQAILSLFTSVGPSLGQITSQLSSGGLGMTFTDAQKEELVQNILRETASSTAEGLAENTGLLDLGDQITPLIADKITPAIINQLTSAIGDLTSSPNFNNAVNNSFKDTTLGGVLGQGYAADGGIIGSFAVPMVDAITPSFGMWVGDSVNSLVTGNWGTAVTNTFATEPISLGSASLGSGVPSSIGSGALGNPDSIDFGGSVAPTTGLSSPSLSLSSAAPTGLASTPSNFSLSGATPGSSLSGTPSSISLGGSSAPAIGATSQTFTSAPISLNTSGSVGKVSEGVQSTVVNNSAASGANATKGMSLSGVGDAMKGALPGIAGGMIGDLAGNIPVVGGLIAPMASVGATAAVAAAIGGTTWSSFKAGLLTTDIGLNLGVGMGFSSTNKAIGSVIKNTGKSNSNEEHANKDLDTIQSMTTQTCTHSVAIDNANKNLVKYFYIQQADAGKAKYLGLTGRLKSYLSFMNQGYQSAGAPGASLGRNGQSFFGTLGQIIADRIIEQNTKTVDLARSGTYGNEVSQRIALMNQGDSDQSTFTQEQWNRLRNPSQASQLSDNDWLTGLTSAYEPGNNPASRLILTTGRQIAANAAIAQDTRDELMANGGIPNGRVCQKWVNTGSGGYCAEWRTTTPGSVLRDTLMSYVSNLLGFYPSNSTNGSDFVNQAPDLIQRFGNLAANPNTSSIAQRTNNPGSDPCPDPAKGCPKTGWQNNQTNLQSDANALQQGATQDFNKANDSGDVSTGGDSGNVTGDNNPPLPPPEITKFDYSDTDKRVSWESVNAFFCFAKNDWVGTTISVLENTMFVTTASIGVTDQSSGQTYELSCENGSSATTTSLTIPQ